MEQEIIEWYHNATDAESLLNTLQEIIRNGNEIVAIVPKAYTRDMVIGSAFIVVNPKPN